MLFQRGSRMISTDTSGKGMAKANAAGPFQGPGPLAYDSRDTPETREPKGFSAKHPTPAGRRTEHAKLPPAARLAVGRGVAPTAHRPGPVDRGASDIHHAAVGASRRGSCAAGRPLEPG